MGLSRIQHNIHSTVGGWGATRIRWSCPPRGRLDHKRTVMGRQGTCRHATSGEGSATRTPLIASVRAVLSTKRPTQVTRSHSSSTLRGHLCSSTPVLEARARCVTRETSFLSRSRLEDQKYGGGRVLTTLAFRHRIDSRPNKLHRAAVKFGCNTSASGVCTENAEKGSSCSPPSRPPSPGRRASTTIEAVIYPPVANLCYPGKSHTRRRRSRADEARREKRYDFRMDILHPVKASRHRGTTYVWHNTLQ